MMNTEYAKALLKSYSFLKSPQVRDGYTRISSQVRDFSLKHPLLVKKISEKTGLAKEEVQELLESSTTIITFTTLMGMDMAARLPGAHFLHGAVIGAGIGICLVIGQFTIKLWLNNHPNDFVVELVS